MPGGLTATHLWCCWSSGRWWFFCCLESFVSKDCKRARSLWFFVYGHARHGESYRLVVQQHRRFTFFSRVSFRQFEPTRMSWSQGRRMTKLCCREPYSLDHIMSCSNHQVPRRVPTTTLGRTGHTTSIPFTWREGPATSSEWTWRLLFMVPSWSRQSHGTKTKPLELESSEQRREVCPWGTSICIWMTGRRTPYRSVATGVHIPFTLNISSVQSPLAASLSWKWRIQGGWWTIATNTRLGWEIYTTESLENGGGQRCSVFADSPVPIPFWTFATTCRLDVAGIALKTCWLSAPCLDERNDVGGSGRHRRVSMLTRNGGTRKTIPSTGRLSGGWGRKEPLRREEEEVTSLNSFLVARDPEMTADANPKDRLRNPIEGYHPSLW